MSLLCAVYFALLFVKPAGAFTCPSLFNWYPDLDDCSKFYRCIWGESHSFTCPAGTLWSHGLLTCDYKDHVKCATSLGSVSTPHAHRKTKIKKQESQDLSADSEFDVLPQSGDFNKEFLSKDSYTRDDYNRDIYSNVQAEDQKRESVHYISTTPREQVHEKYEDGNHHLEAQFVYTGDTRHGPWHRLDDSEKYSTTDSQHQWGHFTEDGQEQDITRTEAPGDLENDLLSERFIQQQILGESLFAQQHAPSLQSPGMRGQENKHDALLFPSQVASADSWENTRRLLYREFILNKLLQLPLYSGFMHSPHSYITTDGTYHVLGLDLLPPRYHHLQQFEPYTPKKPGPTEPWPLENLFRAGYGYKRIFHKK